MSRRPHTAGVVVLIALLQLLVGLTVTPGPVLAASPNAVPLFAYYYQWFDPTSWNRAKIDYPQLGRYSSDDPRIMREHIQMAKAVGIDGFIVSWKDTSVNDRRLQVLAGVAAEEKFSLAMIYQGLDFNRNPLPVGRVAADFVTFRDKFASNPVFYRLAGKPLTIWSGTWAFTHAEVAKVTAAVRSSVLVLSTEKSLQGYRRIADVTDGDAYYWSSVNPSTNKGYTDKLTQMSAAIHADGKYWIAPFASGFDARMVGGSKAVPRDDGRTLRIEYAAALHSSPDILGLISWNEFSENTYVEPSQRFGRRYLDVLSEIRNTRPPTPSSAVDSSESRTPGPGSSHLIPNLVLLSSFPLLLILAVGIVARRRRSRDPVPSHNRRQPPSNSTSPLIKNGRG